MENTYSKSFKGAATVLPEVFFRQLRWREPVKQLLGEKQLLRRKTERIILGQNSIEQTLATANWTNERPILIHAALSGVILDNNGDMVEEGFAVARLFNKWISEIAGNKATIVMPTFPRYKDKDLFLSKAGNNAFYYNPKRTLSKTGLLSEVFRKQPNVIRSPIPLQSLAAFGPKAEEIIQSEVVKSQIPPHGMDSPYYRLAISNCLILGVCIPLHKYLTMVHLVEDLNFSKNHAKGFYRTRHFSVEHNGLHDVVMYERHPEVSRSYCSMCLRHDLLSNNILMELSKSGAGFDYVNSESLMRYMLWRAEKSNYPYFLPSLSGPYGNFDEKE